MLGLFGVLILANAMLFLILVSQFITYFSVTYANFSTLKPQYNKPQYSEFRDIVIKIQLPF